MMADFSHLTAVIIAFFILVLASRQFGEFFAKARLPLITGFMFTGILVGPNFLGFIEFESVGELHFVDQVSLAVIAFAAGGELYLRELKGRLKSIGWITFGLVLSTFTLGSFAILLLGDFIPFLAQMPSSGRIGVAIIVGAILVARSPSSAIAIISELRAKGPFTQTALGVTVVMDIVVIVLFAVNSSIADSLILDTGMDIGFIAVLLAEILVSIGGGYLLGKLLGFILGAKIFRFAKIGLILLSGYGIFIFAEFVREFSHHHLTFEIFLEPLLICMVAGFVVTNYTRQRRIFSRVLAEVSPVIFVAFFTLIGASLSFDVLKATWSITLILVGVRLLGIFVGSYVGGTIAKDPPLHNRLGWMAYITQAGVGLGLAKEVAAKFPGWGEQLATVVIAVIVINQLAGPPFFKWVLQFVGEAHHKVKTEPEPYDGVRDAIIFGLENNSYLLARQLMSHGWQVKIASRKLSHIREIPDPDGIVHHVPDFSLASLMKLEAHRAEAVVTMLSSDEESLEICQTVRYCFDVKDVVVRLNDISNLDSFSDVKATIVEPTYAIINLLDHFVRAPVATSLIMGMDKEHDIVGLELRDPALEGMLLHELRLPFDVVILSISRKGEMTLPEANTGLYLGDWITMVGPQASLEKAALLFDVDFPVGRPSSTLTAPPVVEPRVPRRGHQLESKPFVMTDYVELDLLQSRIKVTSKEELFRRIAEVFTRAHDGEAAVFEAALWAREHQKNSIIVDGLAIPHAMVDELDRTYLGVLTLDEPIDYLSKKDADIIVYMFGPLEDRHNYLKLLAGTATMCAKVNLLDRLRSVSTAEQIKDTLIDCNREVRASDDQE